MTDPQRPAWLVVLAHEMRTPLASILGYGELIEDGLFGPLEPRAIDALKRVRYAAMHLNTLVDGIDRLGDTQHSFDERTQQSLRALVEEAYDLLRLDAEGRGVEVTFADDDVTVLTEHDDALRELTLALSAAVKASPGQALQIGVSDHTVVVSNTKLAERDDLDSLAGEHLSGPGLRIVLARQAFRFVGGTITLETEDAGTRTLRLIFPDG